MHLRRLPPARVSATQHIIIRVAGCALIAMTILSIAISSTAAEKEFPAVFNTEAAGQRPPTPDEMLKFIELPPGFNVTLFAGEPDVQQPICMDFDDRGRLWVAENYTYSGGPYETKLRDRVIILEDADGDGRHDSRKVFWDKGFMLTSLTWGFGGLWILHDGTLSFIPDKNGDDLPDGEPVVMLDGWSKECGHNFVSGLIWGLDGWLYGRHGIVDTSYPGVPGTPKEERPAMNCGIWRYHPTKHLIEVICNGTTNPWGLDYNDDGQFFMTNNVQGHLWHVIPGARHLRMYGQDFNPHSYELMDMTADHYHWDTKTKWSESRDGVANDLGGGHSHVGALIYNGDNFPPEFRGKIFMCNTHGRRINVNRLDREGSGYVGRREPDFLLVKNPWFRGVDLKIGPDDLMYVADWADNGECHDHDGIHRTSGRIYRISHGVPKRTDVAQLFAKEKGSSINPGQVECDWLGRHERRIAQEWASRGELRLKYGPSFLPPNAKSLLYCEALKDAVGEPLSGWIRQALRAPNAVTRAQAVHLATLDDQRRTANSDVLVSLATEPQPADVLLALVSVMQRFEQNARWKLASAVLGREENARTIAADKNLTLMTWYAIEPVVSNSGALELLDSNPKLQQFAVRRLASEISEQTAAAEAALRFIGTKATCGIADAETVAAKLLTSFKLGLAGRAKVNAPQGWDTIEKQLRAIKNRDVALAVDALAVLFGDGAAIADLRSLASKSDNDPAARERAIEALAQAKDADSVPLFLNLLSDRAVADAAIKALAGFEHPDTAKVLLKRFSGLKDGNRSLAIDTLASRKSQALELVAALDDGRIEAGDVSAAQVRQLLAFNEPRISSVIAAKWGVVQETSEAKSKAMQHWKSILTGEALTKANLENGLALFKKSCASCHKLYGEGQTIGPDITGANRSNLEYMLVNIVDPSSVVAKQFTTSVVVLKDGRVITGVRVAETEQTVVIQTEKEQLTLAREEIENTRATGKSLMPDGLLDSLTEAQVRDLFGFVMYRR